MKLMGITVSSDPREKRFSQSIHKRNKAFSFIDFGAARRRGRKYIRKSKVYIYLTYKE